MSTQSGAVINAKKSRKKTNKISSKVKKGMTYIPKNSLIHNLDPVTKIFTMIVVSIGAIISGSLLIISLMFLFVLAFVEGSGLMKVWLGNMRILTPLILVTIIIDVFFTSGANPYGGVLYSADFWLIHLKATAGTLLFAARMSLQILTIGGFSFLFVMTTPYSQFVKSMSLVGIPKTFTFSLGYALKSITSLSLDATNILDAQTSRGLVIDKNLILKKPAKLLSLFVPMIVSVLERANQVSDAMQCRGYGLYEKTTVYRAPKMKKNDYLIIGLSTAVLILNISLTYNLQEVWQ